MKLKTKSYAATVLQARPAPGSRAVSRCLTMLAAVIFLATVPRVYANRVGLPAGGTVLQPGTTFTVSSTTVFPLKITQNGTYVIAGNYSGNYGLPLGYSGGTLTAAQSAERRTPENNAATTGLVNVGATNHGIYVAFGLKDVTVVLRNVGLLTTGAGNAAFVIDGMDATSGTLAAAFQGHADGSDVVVSLEGRNMLYSGNIVACDRAGLEVWKGSTVYIEGSGSLLAKSSTTRNYSTSAYPRLSTDDHPQGSPYWDGTDASYKEDVRSNNNGGKSGAAGIGAGDVNGSGGNVVIRENPTVIAISGAHGAGIGGGWGTGGQYRADILISGGTVESWGGQHGAGIGGGCAGGQGTIVVLPLASVYSASYDPGRAMLGQMSNVIFFGNPDDSRLALYTEDYREVDMFLDMSKNGAVRDVIERLGGGINPSNLPLGKTRNNWPVAATGQHRPNYTDWAATTAPAIQTGPDKYVLLLNGGFIPANMDVAFLTGAKTEKNHSYSPVPTRSDNVAYVCQYVAGGALPTYGLNYPAPAVDPVYNANSPKANHFASATPSLRNVPRFVMIAPSYIPSVAISPSTPPELYDGYAVTDPLNKITLTIGNIGNQKLYNPEIIIIGNDYELAGNPGTSLQAAINAALASLLFSDEGGFYIPAGSTFQLELRLKHGRNPGTSYDGWVLFSTDNLPEAPVPRQFNINVLEKVLPPPDLMMEMPTDTVVNGPFKIRAKFKNRLGQYPYGVKNLTVGDIFVDHGTVTSVVPDVATENPTGYFSDWIISVTPNPGLPNRTPITTVVKQGAAEDEIQARTQTASQPQYVVFSSEFPYAAFNIAEGAVLSSLDTLLIYINGNGITPGKQDSVYIGSIPFTATGALASLQAQFMLTQLPSTVLDIATPGQYELLVTDDNNLRTGSPSPVGFPNGSYEFEIPGNYIRNFDGNYLPNTKLHFSIQMPEIPDGGAGTKIVPQMLDAPGGTVRIWVGGKNLTAAAGNLFIVFNDLIPGYTLGEEVPVPAASFTDTTAYLDVVLPPNMTATAQPYNFTVRLHGRQPSTDVIPVLTATVGIAAASLDSTQITAGYREGLHAYPHRQVYTGGPVDLTLAGKNLFRLNIAPYSNLRVRVKKDGTYTATAIPVHPPVTIGDIVVPLGSAAYTTAGNFTAAAAVYVYELWYDVSGVPTPVPETSSNMPYVADSTVVAPGLDELIRIFKQTHHVVSQQVANDPPKVKKWLTPRLNAIEVLHNFGLTVAEGDITYTAFDEAVAGTLGMPKGMNGSFVFTLKLHTVPEVEITLNTGEIIAVEMPAIVIERDVSLPAAEGYRTDPQEGLHRVESGCDFTFYIVPVSGEADKEPPTVTTNRHIGTDAEGVVVEADGNSNGYFVTIREIREPITIYIRRTPDAGTGVAGTADRVWSGDGCLHIRAAGDGEAKVYSIPGLLVATAWVKAGMTVDVPLPAGMYIVSFRGATYKALAGQIKK
ncbi:MAG: hypothetical protein LBK07_06505 [Tannerella sp.]|jgi:hypothetical protein|nr:hypothetical protein [Tannerella sp.]